VTGAAMAAAGVNSQLGSSGTVVPSPTPVWPGIYGVDVGSTNSQTISGITSPITLSLSNSGGGALLYSLNGVATHYTGSFTVNAGDILLFTIAVGLAPKSGTITVTNVSNGGATLANINYVVNSSGGGGGRGILP
jgi:hypothetical protein